jgi:M3 family oligoendopeptidase
MSTVPRFDEIPYERPDLSVVESATQERLKAWDEAADASARVELVRKWDEERIALDTLRSIAHVRFELDTRDSAAKAEKEFFDDAAPRLTELALSFLKRVVAASDREALAAELGDHALNMWEVALKTYDPAIADDRRAESRLTTSYNELLAALKIPFRGKEYSMPMLAGFYGDADRSVRLEALQARFSSLEEHRETLDNTFHELVQLRHGMAKKLGYDSYTPLAYALLRRTDYGPEQVAEFRRQVRDTLVPLASRIRARHAKTLGVSDYGYHDHSVRDELGVPKPQGDHDWMLDQASTLFRNLGDDFSEFFELMREKNLMDLKTRDGKAGGGFCIDLPQYKVPFVFANFNGTEDDVNVFTHECGHAFQAWRSMDLPLSDYFVPTFDAAEIHSMSLEMLSHPQVDLFFGDDAERYRQGHLEKAILFIPYGTAVDEFQHRVYAEPDMTPDQRADVWKELEAIYLPERRYENMPFAESGRFWQAQRHVYMSPFYYIDYCLAQTCALQFWRRARMDRPESMKAYRKLCGLGGLKPFTNLVADVGLNSPFEDGCLADIAGSVAEELGL